MDETFNISTDSKTQEMITPSTSIKNKTFRTLSTKAYQSAKRKPNLNPPPLRMERELQKLQKFKCLKKKQLKSEKAKSTAAAIANKVKPLEVINLDMDNESDCSDVTMTSVLPPPTFTVENSTDEENITNKDNTNNNEAGILDDDEDDENNFDNEATKRKSAVEKTSQNKRSDKIEDICWTSHKIKQKKNNKKSSIYSTVDDNEINDAVHSDDRNSVSSGRMADIKFKSTLNTSVKGQDDGDQDKKGDRSEAENTGSDVIEENDDSTKLSKSDPTPFKTNKENVPPLYNTRLSWNNEIRVHYNDSWQGEPFILSELLQKMNPDRDVWKICMEDRCNIAPNKRRYNPKCRNCNQFGHTPSQCKRPIKPLICYMCGESGHIEPQCPNTICLTCGNKTQVFMRSCNFCIHQNSLTCSTCKVRGHSSDYCPDIWRRYHSTTQQHINPNKTVNNNPRKYCCNCGGRGHLSDDCRKAVHTPIVSTSKSNQRFNGGIKQRC